MAKPFPFRGVDSSTSTEPQLVEIDDDAADDVFQALSSDTARAIFSQLYEEPATASDIADAVDISIQNTRYHLERLESAGLIEPVDTWYSSRGNEMTVYGPTKEPLVVTAGTEESTGIIRRVLKNLLGAVAVLALASLLIDRLVRRFGISPIDRNTDSPENGEPSVPETATSVSPDPTTAQPTPTEANPTTPTQIEEVSGPIPNSTATPTETPVTSTPTEISVASVESLANATATSTPPTEAGLIDPILLPVPGVLFFAGGIVTLGFMTAWWYWYRYRPLYPPVS